MPLSLQRRFTIGALLEWILCTPMQFVVGYRIHKGAFAALMHRSFTMDVLLSLVRLIVV